MDGKWFGEFSRQVEMCRVVSISAEASSTCFVHGRFHRPGFFLSVSKFFRVLSYVPLQSCWPLKSSMISIAPFPDHTLLKKKFQAKYLYIRTLFTSTDSARFDGKLPHSPSIHSIHPSKVSDTKRKRDTYVALVETNRDTGTFLSHRDEIIGDDWLATGRLLAEVVEVGADSKFLQCFWVRRWVHRLGA